ncbi:Rid family hydrolase [Mycolicibacterium arenosum]|uniref:Rid family hydrolase n=1 Tax=Mycolicibacterium arenosum TaxID=2952157 RepID=A0ABT1LX93_9MYCO|nr:Rid family hydrolase [Mycolicibacterium sp. CAU 1645]MCP9271523.1 Rid family hydrolase [Mycolicibacterium sp. CAU 1645]
MHEVKSETEVEFFVTPGFGEKLKGMLHYSQAVRIGNRVEISGHGGWDDDINIAEELEDEIVTAFDNIERTLATAGATWRDVVHVNSYHKLADGAVTIGADHNDVMAAQFRQRMGDRAPIWTQTGVTVLGAPTMRVEIRVTAVVRD